VSLEYGDTALAHSVFVCGFPELQVQMVDKSVLEAKLHMHGFLTNFTLGNQEDASLFWTNLTECGPVAAMACIWAEDFRTCGSCQDESHELLFQSHIHVPQRPKVNELSAKKIASHLSDVLAGAYSMFPVRQTIA
jgi:hypothetical protein